MHNIATISYALSSILFAGLALFLRRSAGLYWHSSELFWPLLATSIWGLASTYHSLGSFSDVTWIWGFEGVRNLTWLLFLLQLLNPLFDAHGTKSNLLIGLRRWLFCLFLCFILTLLGIRYDIWSNDSVAVFLNELLMIEMLLFCLLGMSLLEQLFREISRQKMWAIKYFFFALAAMFVYDFYLYTDALLFKQIDSDIWSARGAVNAMAFLLIGITLSRGPDWHKPFQLSRRMVFHSTALLVSGLYMLAMAVVGYYIELNGGQWGSALQIIFLVASLLVLLSLFFSGQIRARFKVFMNKYFFAYRYDYRNEWLRLMELLAGSESVLSIQQRVIVALGELADSPGGILWLKNAEGEYFPAAYLNTKEVAVPAFSAQNPLIELMQNQQWIVELNDYRASVDAQKLDISLPDWLQQDDRYWLMVPLLQEDSMLGFVMLSQPRAPIMLNWENRDLLKTTGMQAAIYLASFQAAEQLAVARQFESFNRLSAFVVHDLKNLIGQLSLLTKNSVKHKHKPEFIDDAVKTIENSVTKMNKLMEQLRDSDNSQINQLQRIDLVEELKHLAANLNSLQPAPVVEARVATAWVSAQPDRLLAVFGQVLQNAIDATPADGTVKIVLRMVEQQVWIDFIDNGVGMTPDFIRDRLFKPFDSTKGLTGMGIGAYECREVVHASGGRVQVQSQLGHGTVFSIILPVLSDLQVPVSNRNHCQTDHLITNNAYKLPCIDTVLQPEFNGKCQS